MAILNVNLAVVAIKQFVSHNAHVDPVVLADALADTQLNSATYVQLMNALTSKTRCWTKWTDLWIHGNFYKSIWAQNWLYLYIKHVLVTISINSSVASGRKSQKYHLILDHIRNFQLSEKISVLHSDGYLRMKRLKKEPIHGILLKKQKICMPTAWIPIPSMQWVMNSSKNKSPSHGRLWDEQKMDNLPIRIRFKSSKLRRVTYYGPI